MKISGKQLKTRSGPLVMPMVIAVSLVLSIGMLMPVDSQAASVTGDSNTYVQSSKDVDNQRILGAYEYLDLAVQDLGNETISFHTGGWLRYDFQGQEFGSKNANDVQYSYLSFKSKTDNAIVNLGRVMVFEGVAQERVDGIYARTDLKGNFSVSAFGGMPVEVTEIDTPGNNEIYGARLAHQIPGLYRIGLSYLKEIKDSTDFRKEEGMDLWFHPIDKVDLVGRSNYEAITKGWMENTYNLVLGPFDKLRFTTEASWIDYKDYFHGTTSAVFRLETGVLDPNEKVRILGEVVNYALTDKVSIAVDYKTFDYKIMGNAKTYGGTMKYDVAGSGGAGASINMMDGDTDRLKYSEYRVYGYRKIDKFDLALDILDVKYKESINGVSNAYSASLAAQYEVTHNLKVGADIEYSKNPDFDKEVKAFLKAIYRFDLGSGARKEGV